MKTSMLTAACSAALLTVMATGAMSDDGLSGQVAVTAASEACPTALVSGGALLSVHIAMADGSVLPPATTLNHFRYNFSADATARVARPLVRISGEIRDYGVPGCTVAFEGGTPARLAAAGHAPLARGCRGVCGL